jgi:hypothetical protein
MVYLSLFPAPYFVVTLIASRYLPIGKCALTIEDGSSITDQAYYQEAQDLEGKRMDTLSVIPLR